MPPGYVSKKTIREVKDIFRMYGFRLHTHAGVMRSAALPEETIAYVTPWVTEEMYVSAAMHELQHLVNAEEGKYPAYHGRLGSVRYMRAAVLHGLQAEKYTDRRARELAGVFFPGVRFHASYSTKRGVRWYKERFMRGVKDEYLKHFKRF